MPLHEGQMIASAIQPMPRPRLRVVQVDERATATGPMLEASAARRMFAAMVLWILFAAALGHMLYELDRL